MCPDIPYDDKEYRVKNSYTDEKWRVSFSVELRTCNKNYNPDCKDLDKIKEFLSTFFFTIYATHDEVIFDKTGEVVITPKD